MILLNDKEVQALRRVLNEYYEFGEGASAAASALAAVVEFVLDTKGENDDKQHA